MTNEEKIFKAISQGAIYKQFAQKDQQSNGEKWQRTQTIHRKVNACDVKPTKRCSSSLVKKTKIVTILKYHFHLPTNTPNLPESDNTLWGGRALGRRSPGEE